MRCDFRTAQQIGTTMQTNNTLDLTADVIDVRDIIERYEALEDAADGLPDAEERCQLAAILDELKGKGGDEKWRGDWYPVTLIANEHFEDHARELLEDCGTIPRDLPWFVAIDWETTAQHIQGDYTSIDIDGVTYWYR
jgi:hypothetical protein